MNLKPYTITIAILAAGLTPLADAANAQAVTQYTGMCDASGSVPVDASLFVVGNDEDNTLRVY